MSAEMHATPADELLVLWHELERRGATVNRIPLNVHPDILQARIRHESRRLRALDERPD